MQHSPRYRSVTSPDCSSFLPLKSHICKQFPLQIFHPHIQLCPGWRGLWAGPWAAAAQPGLSMAGQCGKQTVTHLAGSSGRDLTQPSTSRSNLTVPMFSNKAAIQEPGEACSSLTEPWRIRAPRGWRKPCPAAAQPLAASRSSLPRWKLQTEEYYHSGQALHTGMPCFPHEQFLLNTSSHTSAATRSSTLWGGKTEVGDTCTETALHPSKPT